MAVFALVVGLIGGYQVGQAQPEEPPPAEPTPVTATPAEPHRVLLVGDSILRQTGPALDRALGPGYDVRNRAVNGSGLLTPQYYDWSRRLPAILDRADPDAVVFSFIGNYTGDPDGLWRKTDGDSVPSIEAAVFGPEWGRETDAAMAAIGATGARVVLVLPPPMPVPALQQVVDVLRVEYRDVARRWPFVSVVDAAGVLDGPADRAPDGVHLSAQGERHLADALVAELRPR